MSLPKRALIDTGFFILANRERPKDPRTDDHEKALRALEDGGTEILIAAPSLAEIFRKPYKTPPPATKWPTVAFGRAAAKLLGEKLPQRFITNTGIPGGYWKYDLLIAACAVIAKVDAILVADVDYTNILKGLDPAGTIKLIRANDIVSTQQQLALMLTPPASSAPAASIPAATTPATATPVAVAAPAAGAPTTPTTTTAAPTAAQVAAPTTATPAATTTSAPNATSATATPSGGPTQVSAPPAATRAAAKTAKATTASEKTTQDSDPAMTSTPSAALSTSPTTAAATVSTTPAPTSPSSASAPPTTDTGKKA